jgi:hypothetical protein
VGRVDSEGRFTLISDVSVPYQYRPQCAGYVWKILFKIHGTTFLCRTPHGRKGNVTDTSLIRHWYVTDTSLIRHWHVTDTSLISVNRPSTCRRNYRLWRKMMEAWKWPRRHVGDKDTESQTPDTCLFIGLQRIASRWKRNSAAVMCAPCVDDSARKTEMFVAYN